jgi:hypothetical protein
MIVLRMGLLTLALLTTCVVAQDVSFREYMVYEFDEKRFAPNDSKPTLYKISLAGKADALWVEGTDYNYQWLTIVPYAGIEHIKLQRRRGNPYVHDTGSWIGRQLAKAGDIRGWFTISFVDRKGKDREVVLLAPVKEDRELADFLRGKIELELEIEGEAEKLATPSPVVTAPPAPTSVAAPLPEPTVPPTPTTPTPVKVKLIDLMTVSEFRAAGLGKLKDAELSELDAWINRFLAQER